MPNVTTRIDSKRSDNPVCTSVASPLTITLPPSSNVVSLTVTSASAITITGMTGPGHAIDISHTP